MPTCAFLSCDQVERCCLPGGCVTKRFGRMGGATAVSKEAIRADAPALNGTKPTKANRDPRFIQRHRKKLT